MTFIIKIIISLVVIYFLINLFTSFKKNSNQKVVKNKFKAPNKDKIKDAEFEDAK